MVDRLVPHGLRTQLAIAIALVAILSVGASFIAIYSEMTSRLRVQIDQQLGTQVSEWTLFQKGAHADLSSPAVLRAVGERFIKAQRYHPESLVIVVQPAGGPPVSNHAELVAAEESQNRNSPEAIGLLNSSTGLANASVPDVGSMRVLAQPIDYGGRPVGTLRVASPLTPVQNAQASLRRTFLIVGVLALLVAIGAGIALASVISAPLRRMARVASAIGAGELSIRLGPVAWRGELGVLSRAFDQMLERLERAFRRQRDFVSDASHELRTPLSVLRAQVEVLDRETDERRRREGTRLLLRRLDELDRLVGDMLTLASAEAGQLIEPEAIELSDFFEDLRRDLPLFGERDFQLQAADGTLEADPDRLTQVLRNLVRNAVIHTRPGDRVSVAAHPHHGHLEITVMDDGPGIPPDQLEQVFERFRRLDGGRSRASGGSGLGLAIARAIIEAHGGTIHAESTPGHGATFRIDLPGYHAP